MKVINLFNDRFQYNEDGLKIKEEFNKIITPFFKKYEGKMNPVEFESLVNSSINNLITKNYIETAIKFYKK